MQQERFYQLLSRKFANEATIHELDELNRIINSDSQCKALYDNLQQSKSQDDFVIQYRANRAFELLEKKAFRSNENNINYEQVNSFAAYKLKKKNYVRKVFIYTAIAASILLVCYTLIFFYQPKYTSKSVLPHSEIVTLKGQKSKITLPDGTQVWLNSDSKISYPEKFEGTSREVQLIGEAFFDVAHNKNKPFIIHTKEMNIKVLGTAFNVKAYPQDNISEAALIRGSIEVFFPNRPNQNLILKPNEKLEVKSTSNNLNVKTTNNTEIQKTAVIAINPISFTKADSIIVETAWKSGKLVFDSKPFLYLVEDLERWYDVTIVVENEPLKKKLFTASFNNETIEDVLRFLKLSYPFNYTYNKETKKVKIY